MALQSFKGPVVGWMGRFLVVLVVGFAFQFVPPVQTTLTNVVVITLAAATEWIVSSFGGLIVRNVNVISHGVGGATVHVTEACDGIGLFILFAAAVLASRLRYLHLVQALGLGFLVIQIFNLLRVILLFFLRPGPNLLFDVVHAYFLPLLSAVILLALFLAAVPTDPGSRFARSLRRE